MAKHFCLLLSLALCLLFAACAEDRTREYQALIGQDSWIKEQMNIHYLWREDMPADGNLNFFLEPEVFFKNLLSTKCQGGKGDKYSYLEKLENNTKSIRQESTYGFDFFLFQPVQTPKQLVARITYVLNDSPAAQAGLKRGDWISGLNGNALTEKNYRRLYSGEAVTLIRAQTDTLNQIVQWTDTDSIRLAASQPMEDNPFVVDTTYIYKGKRVGYLFYNGFRTGPTNTAYETTYSEQMNRIFTRFKNAALTDFVLDLRYNTGGHLTCAQQLASLLVPNESLDQPFCHLSFNSLQADSDTTYLMHSELAQGNNLNLPKLYVIVGSLTASASEAVINGLKPYMDVILIGSTTEGKNVASMALQTPTYPEIVLHPIVATVSNGLEQSDYHKGMKPDYACSEEDQATFTDTMYELGDTRELLLKHTLGVITGEITVPTPSGKRMALQPLGPSAHQRQRMNLLLPIRLHHEQ